MNCVQGTEPARGFNGSYSGTIYATEALRVVANHNATHASGNAWPRPLFLYIGWQINHTPLQVPGRYLDRFPHIDEPRRKAYSAMTAFVDDGLGNLTAALQRRGMWQNTLLVVTSDNGGPAGSGNNWPLRGVSPCFQTLAPICDSAKYFAV